MRTMKISSEANSASANELQETITKNVRVLIAAKSVNQEDLAEALGIAQSGLSRKVNRRTDWSSSDIANLASFFGISFADIVTPLPLFLPSGGADYYVHPNSSYIDPRAQQMQQRNLAVPAGVRYLRMPVEGEGRIHGAVGPRAFVMPSPDSDLDGPGGLGPRFSARTRFGLPHLDSNQDKGFQRPVCCHYTMGEWRKTLRLPPSVYYATCRQHRVSRRVALIKNVV